MKKTLLAATLFISFKGYSTGIPTVDLAALPNQVVTAISSLKTQVQGIEQHITQLKELKASYDQIKELKDQLQTAKDTLGTMEGIKYLSKVLNNPLMEEYRSNMSAEWKDVFDITDDALMDSDKAMRKLGNLKNRDKYSKYLYSDDIDRALGTVESYNDFAGSQLQTESIARLAIEDANQGYQNAEQLLQQIDQQEDIKSSSDLTNRILVENTVLLNKLLQINAAATMQKTNADTHNFEKLQLDKAVASGVPADFSSLDVNNNGG